VYTFLSAFLSSSNEYFLPKSFLSLHFVDSSGVMIGSELTPSAQKEARQGERGFEAFNSFLEQST
jgi:hypothetical protein